MSLMQCPECGKEISDKSVSCIFCGYPLASAPADREYEKEEIVDTGKEEDIDKENTSPNKYGKLRDISVVGFTKSGRQKYLLTTQKKYERKGWEFRRYIDNGMNNSFAVFYVPDDLKTKSTSLISINHPKTWSFLSIIISLFVVIISITTNTTAATIHIIILVLIVSFYFTKKYHDLRVILIVLLYSGSFVQAASYFEEQGHVEKRRMEKEHKTLAFQQKKEKAAKYFIKHKAKVLATAKEGLRTRQYQQALDKIEVFRYIQDSDLTHIAQQIRLAMNKEKEQVILRKLRKVPSRNYRDNRELYRQLVQLSPQNKRYKRKFTYYVNKEKTTFEIVETYTDAGKTWKIVVVPGSTSRAQLIALAKRLHRKYPNTFFNIFDNGNQKRIRQFIISQQHPGNRNYPYPERWLNRHDKGMINMMLSGSTMRWQLYSTYEGTISEL